MTVNGEAVHYRLDPSTPLLWALRDASNLTGTKHGCDSRDCGACTVIVDGHAVTSCGVAIGELDGAQVTTIEGLSSDRSHPVQQAWLAEQVDDVRLLRTGLHHGDRRASAGESQPERRAGAGPSEHLPLRRLPAHPQGDHAGRRSAQAPPTYKPEYTAPKRLSLGSSQMMHNVMSSFGKVTAMRKILISLLLAGAAASPALAQDHGRHHDDNDNQREERSQARDERSQAREDRGQAREQAREDRGQAHEQAQQMRAQRFDDSGNAARAQQIEMRQRYQEAARPDRRDFQALAEQRRDARDDARDQRIDQRQQVIRQRQRGDRAAPAGHARPARASPVDVDRRRSSATSRARARSRRSASAARHSNQQHWNTNWRHDGRYDWRNYRHHHRSLFHLGFYYDPFGWGYQPFSIGWRLWPSYYSSRYWINDPWMYRLPYAPPGYVWVRYWNDAILVDTWSGTVADVIPGFFW